MAAASIAPRQTILNKTGMQDTLYDMVLRGVTWCHLLLVFILRSICRRQHSMQDKEIPIARYLFVNIQHLLNYI